MAESVSNAPSLGKYHSGSFLFPGTKKSEVMIRAGNKSEEGSQGRNDEVAARPRRKRKVKRQSAKGKGEKPLLTAATGG
jgi:hypothetical protein